MWRRYTNWMMEKQKFWIAGCNIPLQNLKIRKNTLICCIYRNHQVIVPSGQDCMMPGDSVMIATSGYNISDIKEILED